MQGKFPMPSQPTPSTDITLEEAREILGKTVEKLTDPELEIVVARLNHFADFIFESYVAQVDADNPDLQQQPENV